MPEQFTIYWLADWSWFDSWLMIQIQIQFMIQWLWMGQVWFGHGDQSFRKHSVCAWNPPLRSAKIFKSFVSGKFGDSLLNGYIECLNGFPKLGVQQVTMEYFHLALQAMGEHWRRFSFLTMGFPWSLFRLADLDSDDEFLRMYMNIQGQMSKCDKCMDLEFSSVILGFIPKDSKVEDDNVRCKIHQLRSFLNDLCAVAPISADKVECAHGFSQALLHRWRGTKVTDNVAQERFFWAQVTSLFSQFKSWVWDHSMDAYFNKRLQHFGKKGFNQYSAEKSDKSSGCQKKRALSIATMDRILAFGQSLPSVRKLSGSLALTLAIGIQIPTPKGSIYWSINGVGWFAMHCSSFFKGLGLIINLNLSRCQCHLKPAHVSELSRSSRIISTVPCSSFKFRPKKLLPLCHVAPDYLTLRTLP